MIYLILTIAVHDQILCRTLSSVCRMFRYKTFLEKILRLSYSHVIIWMHILFFILFRYQYKGKI